MKKQNSTTSFVQISFFFSCEDSNILKNFLIMFEIILTSLNIKVLKKQNLKKKKVMTMQRSPHIFKRSKQSFEYMQYAHKVVVYCQEKHIFCIYCFLTQWSFPLKYQLTIEDF